MSKCSRKNLCKNEDCVECFERSFASHEKSKYWDYSRNFTIEEVDSNDDTKTYEITEITPRNVSKGTHIKYNFICGICHHHFMISPDKATVLNNWCSYCTNQKLCDDKNCTTCFNKSFASVSRSNEWDFKKNIKKPREVFKNTSVCYFFTCKACNHSFKKMLSNISRKESWCPYCSNKKLC